MGLFALRNFLYCLFYYEDMFRKGQVAIEFISTYGWAFLVMTLVVSVATSYGLFDIGDSIPDRCNIPNDFRCNSFIITSNFESSDNLGFNVAISNMLGETIDSLVLQGISVEGYGDISEGNLTDCSLTNSRTSAIFTPSSNIYAEELLNSEEWFSGDNVVLSCELANAIVKDTNSRAAIEVNMEYETLRGQFPSAMNFKLLGIVSD